MALDLGEIPVFLHPKLRLFLSMDLVGSTALKQSGGLRQHLEAAAIESDDVASVNQKWLTEIARFFPEIQLTFSRQWQDFTNLAKEIGWDLGAAPEFWKSNGDEIIYTKVIDNHRQCYATIECWLRILIQYRDQLKNNKSQLDVKATAWIAGFPIANSEIAFTRTMDPNILKLETGEAKFQNYIFLDDYHTKRENGENSGYILDYIGPSMDTGFRLAAKSTPRKFMITVDLAYILSKTILSTITHTLRERLAKEQYNSLVIHFDGRHALKGVLSGRPYPLLWIDAMTGDLLQGAEDEIINRPKFSAQKVSEYCQAFLNQNKDYTFTPFIFSTTESLFAEQPSAYEEKLRHIAKTWSSEQKKRDSEERALLGEESDEQLDTFPQQTLTQAQRRRYTAQLKVQMEAPGERRIGPKKRG